MKRRETILVLLVAVLVGMTTGCATSRGEAGGKAGAIRVMTYNIHHGEGMDGVIDLERLADVIVAANPDLVALQEVDMQAGRTNGIDQAKTLGELTGMHSAFAKFMDLQGGEYGLAVLSKSPIDEMKRIQLPPGKHEPRAALAVRTKPSGVGSPLVFVSLHFDWLGEDTERFAQAQSLVEQLASEHLPVILAGDFNDRPESRTMQLVFGSFQNASKPAEDRFTFSSTRPTGEIDFVVFRSAGSMQGHAWPLDEPVASDHRPVVADLVISP